MNWTDLDPDLDPDKVLEEAEASGFFDVKSPDEAVRWAQRSLGVEPSSPTSQEIKMFGQEAVVKQITPFLDSSVSFPHTLILGEPGVGKTHLARWIASKRGQVFEELLAPAYPEDLPHTGIVLLDEVHRQNHPERLFPVMESATVTILGATTRPEKLEPAFASRFFLKLYLTRYSDEAMAEMAKYLLPGAADDVVAIFASASAGNPRQLERIAAVADRVGMNDAETVLSTVQITADGLTDIHLRMLRTLKKGNRPMGLSTLAVMMYIDEDTVKQHERLLVEFDLIELRPNGRLITRAGKQYMAVIEQSQ